MRGVLPVPRLCWWQIAHWVWMAERWWTRDRLGDWGRTRGTAAGRRPGTRAPYLDSIRHESRGEPNHGDTYRWADKGREGGRTGTYNKETPTGTPATRRTVKQEILYEQVRTHLKHSTRKHTLYANRCIKPGVITIIAKQCNNHNQKELYRQVCLHTQFFSSAHE